MYISHLFSQEAESLQEVEHHLEFVSYCVPLHLGADALGLLAHALLPGGDRQDKGSKGSVTLTEIVDITHSGR